MSNLLFNNSNNPEKRNIKRRTTLSRRSFERFEPGKITADRRKSLADRRFIEGTGKLSLQLQ